MRVLHVMECTIGGTRRHLVDVARGQRAAGLDVHLVASTLRDPGFPADLDALEAEGVVVTRLPMVREVAPATDWRHLAELKRLLREVRPDVVHTHSSKGGVLGRQASRATGVGARVHTPHTFAFLFRALFGPLKRTLYRRVEAHYARATDRFVAVSPSEARTFAGTGFVPAERTRVVPNGIDPAPFADAPPLDLASVGLDPTRPTLVQVGLVYAAKGQDLALRALAAPGLERWQLLCVGPGDLTEVRALRASLGLAGRVRFTGPRDDVPSVLAAADALVLPSRWEGMPYVVLEAMAAGRAVVAHPVDGAVDAVVHGETGLLAREVGAEALAESLRELDALGPEGRARLGAAGRERLRAEYTVARMTEGLIGVYEELA